MRPIMCGVESTRGPSTPRKVMADSLVTRSFASALAPMGMLGMGILRGPQAGQDAAHVEHGAQHAGQRVLGVDLVFQVDPALVIHLLELLENGGERHDALAHVALALPASEVAQVLDVNVDKAPAGQDD